MDRLTFFIDEMHFFGDKFLEIVKFTFIIFVGFN
jgi:hypothetical protein